VPIFHLRFGIPQGSVLGSQLFILCAADLWQNFRLISMLMILSCIQLVDLKPMTIFVHKWSLVLTWFQSGLNLIISPCIRRKLTFFGGQLDVVVISWALVQYDWWFQYCTVFISSWVGYWAGLWYGDDVTRSLKQTVARCRQLCLMRTCVKYLVAQCSKWITTTTLRESRTSISL